MTVTWECGLILPVSAGLANLNRQVWGKSPYRAWYYSLGGQEMNKAFSWKHSVPQIAGQILTNGRWPTGLLWSKGNELSSKLSKPNQMQLQIGQLHLTLRSKHVTHRLMPMPFTLKAAGLVSSTLLRGIRWPHTTHYALELAKPVLTTCLHFFFFFL